MATYIYGLYCPIARQIRYIGKSIKPEKRLFAHLRSAKNFDYEHHTARWLRSLIDAGLSPRLVFLEEVSDDRPWQDAERRWIADAELAGWPLTNSTAGGEGLDYRDPLAEARYRANLSAAMKRRFATPEGRAQILAMGRLARANPEVEKLRIVGMREAFKRPEYRARNLEVLAEIAARPEVRAKKSVAGLANFYGGPLHRVIQSPEFKAEQSKRLTERWTDPKHRNKMQQERWSAEKRAAQATAIRTGERLAKLQKALSDPDMIKRRNASIKAAWARRKAEKAA